jgi:hypothetical protein
MPYPERFERNFARTESRRLDARRETVTWLRIDEKVRWCYEHVPAQGTRTVLTLANVGGTTRMDPRSHAPVAMVGTATGLDEAPA